MALKLPNFLGSIALTFKMKCPFYTFQPSAFSVHLQYQKMYIGHIVIVYCVAAKYTYFDTWREPLEERKDDERTRFN